MHRKRSNGCNSAERELQDEYLDDSDQPTSASSLPWLVEGIFVTNQLAVIGASPRCSEWSIMLDMAISLASGSSFLGRFAVPERRTVAVYAPTYDENRLRKAAARICAAKKIRKCDLRWSFGLPRFAWEPDLSYLSAELDELNADVAFFCPLHLCVSDRPGEVDTTSVVDMGIVLDGAARACFQVGVTPIFLHYDTKSARRTRQPGKPLKLDDLACAGMAETFRQALLLDRQSGADSGNGRSLTMTVDGSAGYLGRWNLRIDADAANDMLESPRWQVTVGGAAVPLQTTLSLGNYYGDDAAVMITSQEKLGPPIRRPRLRQEAR